MSLLGNLLWILFGGFLVAIGYLFGGVILCCTLVGIPFGFQLFKLGLLALFPFGQTSVVDNRETGCLYTLMNILWLLCGGLYVCLTHLVLGTLLCVTIIGIPFGMQHFKLMTMALTPFGRDIVPN